MSIRTISQLRTILLKLQLVDADVLNNCIEEAGGKDADPQTVIKTLEQHHFLSPYQAGRLAAGEIDALVLGGYKLEYRNAVGSFARVFRASSIKDGRTVAIKVLRKRWTKDTESIEQFRREANMCKRLRHKNIVPIYDVGSERDHYYFTMEFVEGGNLRDFMNIRKKLSPLEATRVVLDVAEGLEYALRLGMTHRDMKMTNVLLSSEGVAKLVDFGLAGDDLAGGEDEENVQTAIEYATLEKGTSAPNNDPRSDLYFLGAIFYELVSGTPAYERTASREKRKMFGRYTNIRPLSFSAPNLPSDVVHVIEKMMRINPNERYQSATELIRDLRELLNELDPARQPASNSSELAENSSATQRNAHGSSPPTVLCVENRTKHQNLLRDSLSKHGYRPLVLTDAERAITRIQNDDPPACVILMAESIGDDGRIASVYDRAVAYGGPANVGVICVLGEKQSRLKEQLETSKLARVLQLPLTTTQLRHQIGRILRYRQKRIEQDL